MPLDLTHHQHFFFQLSLASSQEVVVVLECLIQKSWLSYIINLQKIFVNFSAVLFIANSKLTSITKTTIHAKSARGGTSLKFIDLSRVDRFYDRPSYYIFFKVELSRVLTKTVEIAQSKRHCGQANHSCKTQLQITAANHSGKS